MIKCTYQGKTFFIRGNECTKLNLPNYTMPFQKVEVTNVQNLTHNKSIFKKKRRRSFISPNSDLS
jgi:hypothetical protein